MDERLGGPHKRSRRSRKSKNDSRSSSMYPSNCTKLHRFIDVGGELRYSSTRSLSCHQEEASHQIPSSPASFSPVEIAPSVYYIGHCTKQLGMQSCKMLGIRPAYTHTVFSLWDELKRYTNSPGQLKSTKRKGYIR
jgi:hypothetical protein